MAGAVFADVPPILWAKLLILNALAPSGLSYQGEFLGGLTVMYASVVATVLFALGYTFRRKLTGKREGLRAGDLLVAYAVLLSISHLQSSYVDQTKWSVVACLPLCIWAMNPRKALNWTLIWQCACALITLQCLLGISYYFVGYNQFFTPGFGPRTAGTYQNPNTFYPLAAFGVPLAFGLAVSWPNKGGRLIWAGFCFICFLGMTLTFSRAGWVALSVTLLANVASSKSFAQHWPQRLGILVACAALLAGAVCLRTGGKAIADRSTRGRISIWANAVHVIKDRPLLGHGAGSYPYLQAMSMNDELRSFNPMAKDAKSLYLTEAVERGVVGVIILLSVLFAFFVAVRNAIAPPGLPTGVLPALGMSVFCVSIIALVDTPLLQPDRLPSTVFILLAWSFVFSQRLGSDHFSRPAPQLSGTPVTAEQLGDLPAK